jgi:hypothetical protein
VGPTYSVTAMWALLMVLNGPRCESAHITLIKMKIGPILIIREESFNSQNLE